MLTIIEDERATSRRSREEEGDGKQAAVLCVSGSAVDGGIRTMRSYVPM